MLYYTIMYHTILYYNINLLDDIVLYNISLNHIMRLRISKIILLSIKHRFLVVVTT